MTAAARSVYYFGFYLYVVGSTLLLIPNIFLRTIQLPETNEVWIRVAGVLVICLGYYYHRSGAGNDAGMFKLTVHVRTFVCLAFAVLAILKLAPPILAGFGIVDLVGAAWTWQALKKGN
ncbi:MAG: hypothetical protein KTQ13_05215 [Ferruginibacter sp.]|nr:hypothetical protein [Ferruginibacter sp.]MBU9936030.1 hypothetical protein [Ferruginibacter sp.]HQY12776.1 hypothetical protein [Ferruginibacter sp.]